jgi:hypothetical protein
MSRICWSSTIRNLRQIGCLHDVLLERRRSGALDAVDDWITCVALNRRIGSAGFFSVYTMPPNQAVSAASSGRSTRAPQTDAPQRVFAGS